MDRYLKCNALDCLAEVKDAAYVTCCSHQYCLDCAHRIGLTSDDFSQRVCPACRTQLPNECDVFRNDLNPPEEWKANVLAGMSPAIIIECAGKALSFWGYQMVMEMSYLEASNRRLAIENDDIGSRDERMLNECKATIDRQGRELDNTAAALDESRQTNETLSAKLATMTSKAAQLQKLYETLKRNATLEEIQNTAAQIGGPNMEAATRGGTLLPDRHPGHQSTYPVGTVVSPRYANAQPVGQSSLGAQISPPYANAFPGFQPLRNSTHGGPPQVHGTPRNSQRHQGSGTTRIGLSGVHGAVAGTPRQNPQGTPRISNDPIRRFVDPQPHRAQNRFSDLGLGPTLGPSRHGANGTLPANYDSYGAPSISSRGRDNGAPPVPGYSQRMTGQRPGVVAGSRGYGRT